MAVSNTPRLGLLSWSASTDPHPNRAEWDAQQHVLDEHMAIDLQVQKWADRPSATVRGRYMWVEDDKNLWRSTGTGWELVTRIGGGGAPRAVTVGTSASEGTSLYAARADHVHSIPLATTGAHGAMNSGDKAKLDSATHNATSSRLVQRDGNGAAQFAQVTATASAPTASNHLTRKDWVEALASGKIGKGVLGANTNLNTVTDDGVYVQSSNANTSAALNYPESIAGSLWVVSSSSIVWQSYLTYTTSAPRLYVRTRYNGSWGAWREQASTDLATTTRAGLMPAADRSLLSGATAATTANSLVRRDSSARFQVSNPSGTLDVVNKGYADGLVAPINTVVNAATANATANTLARRDGAGRFKVANPSAATDVANRGFVEGLTNHLNTLFGELDDDTYELRNDLDPLLYKSGVRYYEHTTGMITGRITVVRVGPVVTVTFEFSGTQIGSGNSYTGWASIGPQLPVGIRPQFNAAVNPTSGPSFRIASNGLPYVRTPGHYTSGTTATLTYVVETEPPSSFTWGTAA